MASQLPMWTPNGEHTNMDTFRERVNLKFSLSLGMAVYAIRVYSFVVQPRHTCTANYAELWQWSVEHYDLFWEELFLYTHIIHSSPYDEVHPLPMCTRPSLLLLVVGGGYEQGCDRCARVVPWLPAQLCRESPAIR